VTAPRLERRWALLYDYVEDAVERRAPHRPAHLALYAERQAAGALLEGGAVGEPPHGAIIVFASEADAQAFAAVDPYVEGGVVTRWRIEPWDVVLDAAP
jgi:uncharacterized protein YciI